MTLARQRHTRRAEAGEQLVKVLRMEAAELGGWGDRVRQMGYQPGPGWAYGMERPVYGLGAGTVGTVPAPQVRPRPVSVQNAMLQRPQG